MAAAPWLFATAVAGVALGRELDGARPFPQTEPSPAEVVPAKAPPPPEQTYDPWELVSV